MNVPSLPEPGSPDSRGASPPRITARTDRARSKGAHPEDARPIAPGGARDAEASTSDREIQAEIEAIPELRFSVAGAEALTRGAVPTVALRLVVERTAGAPVRSATVGVRADIATARRAYDAETEARLVELFGEPERWGTTLRGLGWARTTLLVGPFDDRTAVELPLPCSYDFDVAAAKYLHALRDGEIPLDLIFTGSVLYEVDGRVQAAPVPWDRETTYRLPVSVWREAMDAAFGDTAWLRLDRDTFDRLYAYRARHALTSWEAAIAALLDLAGPDARRRHRGADGMEARGD